MPLPIVTERLVLRAYQDDDLHQLHAVLYSDEAAMRLLGGPRDLAGTRAALERSMNQQEQGGYSFWPVIERESGLLWARLRDRGRERRGRRGLRRARHGPSRRDHPRGELRLPARAQQARLRGARPAPRLGCRAAVLHARARPRARAAQPGGALVSQTRSRLAGAEVGVVPRRG